MIAAARAGVGTPRPGVERRRAGRDQRDRLHYALLELVADRGLQGVSVRALCARAGVSTRSLYSLYGGNGEEAKESCFLASYDRIVRETVSRMYAARIASRDWREGMRGVVQALAVAVSSRPERARIVLVEPYGAGEPALRRLADTHRQFEGLLAQRFASGPQGVRLPPLLLKGIVGGLARVARRALVEGTTAELPDHVDELLAWMLSFGDPCSERVGELAWLEGSPLLAQRVPASRQPVAPRERLLLAAAQIAAAGGYESLSEGALLARAQVPRAAFVESFAGVEDCFIQAVCLRVAQTIAYASMAARAGAPGTEAVYRATQALCTRIAGSPALARLSFVEIFRVGAAGVDARERLIGALARLFFEQLSAAERPGEYAAQASVGALWRIAHDHVVGERARSLPALSGPLAYLLLTPAIGAERAFAEIRAAQARMRGPARKAPEPAGRQKP